MKRHKVVFTDAAIADLADMIDHIVETSGFRRTAHQFVDRIEQRCVRLGETPYAGRARDDLQPGVRTVPFDSVIIVYTVDDEAVSIVNIFGAAQDYETLLRDPG